MFYNIRMETQMKKPTTTAFSLKKANSKALTLYDFMHLFQDFSTRN